MKKLLLPIFAFMLLLTGCDTDVLSDYIDAHNVTKEIVKGQVSIDFVTEVSFEEDGLSEEEKLRISYFDKIQMTMDIKYDDSTESGNSIINLYFNLGGMGFDMTVYDEEDQLYMKMPIIDGYMDISNMDNENDDMMLMYDQEYEKLVDELLDKWNAILRRENVLKGEKTYIMTEEGQIKTMTYTIDVNEIQLKILSDELIALLKGEDGAIARALEGKDIPKEEGDRAIRWMEYAVDRISIDDFKGMAYVDFDGRLLKEKFEIEVSIIDAKVGEPKSMKTSFTIEYKNLGEEQSFNFPTISEDMWIDMDDVENMEDMMPSFNF